MNGFILLFLWLCNSLFSHTDEIINLLYYHPSVISSSPVLKLNPPDGKKTTYNSYIQKKYAKDPRFINWNRRERGQDTSRKVLSLQKGEFIDFKMQFPLNHNLRYSILEGSPIQILLNGQKVETNKIISSEISNQIRIIASETTILSGLHLYPNASPKKKPPILFIVIDSLRGDVPGFNGSEWGVTPNLDRIASQSYNFQNHLVNSSWTRPSTLVFFTGLYPSKVFINFWDYPVFESEKIDFYNSDITTLPSILSKNGYKTVMIGNNPFLTDHRYIGVDVGFEEVYDFSFYEKDTPLITEKILQFLKENTDERPLFVFLNYNDPHKPYEPPYEFWKQVQKGNFLEEKKRNYLGEVAYVDSEIGKVLSTYSSMGLFDPSLLLITSDHGEIMEPQHAISIFTRIYTYFGHGQGLYKGDIHTPLLFKTPYQKASKNFSNVTRSIDLMPTILSNIGISYEENLFDGKTLDPIIRNSEKSERIYYGESRGVRGVQLGDWKLMEKTHLFHRTGPAWDGIIGNELTVLFNLKDDKEEKTPLQNVSKEAELRNFFGWGNTKKNEYCIRIHSEGEKPRKIQISVNSNPGKVKLLQEPDTRKEIYFTPRGFNIEKVLSTKETNQYCFYAYPDISIPITSILIDGRSPQKGEIGAGDQDIYPGTCYLHKKDCLDVFTIQKNEPEIPKKFRIQVWVKPVKTSQKDEKVILEKEAIDILRKQGYIK